LNKNVLVDIEDHGYFIVLRAEVPSQPIQVWVEGTEVVIKGLSYTLRINTGAWLSPFAKPKIKYRHGVAEITVYRQ
jgi:hypothetical protein